MTGSSHLERALPDILEDVGRGPAPDYADTILARTAPIAQRPGWTFPERWLPSAVAARWSVGIWRLPLRAMAAVALIALVLAAGAAAYVGGQLTRLPAVTGPAGNGLIAYDHDGDIYVGDPVTGTTTAIVTGPTNDSSPIFAPDGRHIAFLRGDEAKDVVVVEPDGSGERVVTPTAMSPGVNFVIGIAWTPDSGRIVVDQGSSGEQMILDVSGVADPIRLTPPLRAWPGGGGGFDAASSFRPPLGDKVVATGDIDALRVFDSDLQTATQLARTALERYEHYAVASAAWSPDGSHILFGLRRVSQTGSSWYGDLGVFIIDADGNNLRRVGDGAYGGAWSPDGSMIAFQADGGVTLVDIGSGAKRDVKAIYPTTQLPLTDLRGWSWSPDGRSILVLEERSPYLPRPSRPLVVDVETGATSELPWESYSTPSWQRVPTD